jgi:hypothetical protein
MEGGTYRVNAVLYYPFEELCANTLPIGLDGNYKFDSDVFELGRTSSELMKRQIAFDILNTRGITEGKITQGAILTSYGERINAIILPKIRQLPMELKEKLNAARSAGVEIYSINAEKIEGLDFIPKSIFENELPRADARIDGDCAHVTFMHRSFDDYDIFMLMNCERAPARLTLRIKDNGNEYSEFNVEEYKEIPLSFFKNTEEAIIPLDMNGLTAKVIIRFKKTIS